MQETDRLIGGYVALHIARFTEDELACLEEILEITDADLADWLLGRRAVPPAHDSRMLRDMLEHARGGAR